MALREAIRCVNPQCRSVIHGPPGGGRLLAETARGVVFKEQAGDRLAVLGLWLYAECGKCGARRYNPDIVGLDGMGGQLAQALHEAVARPDS